MGMRSPLAKRLRSEAIKSFGSFLWPITIFFFSSSALLCCGAEGPQNQQYNDLAIGRSAKVETIDIALTPPGELDFKKKSEILKLRSRAVYRYPSLLAGEYKPSETVFGQIADGLPWWGTRGAYYHGTGQRSIEGPSEQSHSILNPFILAVPEFHFRWNPAIIPESVIGGTMFPDHCGPTRLIWYPKRALAEVVYDASCISRTRARAFSLVAYNARDFHLGHILVSYRDSKNIKKKDPPTLPYPNPQFLHAGGSCGYPGGCNNVSPRTPEIENLRITGFPARVVIRFWRKKPNLIEEPSDMEFLIRFE